MITYLDIKQYVEEGKTNEEIKSALEAETREVSDPTGWKMKAVIDRWVALYGAAGQALAGKLSTSLSILKESHVPFVGESVTALSLPSGLSLNEPSSQAMVDFIAVQSQALPEEYRWDADFVTKIKELGIRQELVYPDGVTVEEIQEVKGEEAVRLAEQATAESIRIQTGYLSVATQAAQAALPGTKAEVIAAFTASLDANWED